MENNLLGFFFFHHLYLSTIHHRCIDLFTSDYNICIEREPCRLVTHQFSLHGFSPAYSPRAALEFSQRVSQDPLLVPQQKVIKQTCRATRSRVSYLSC